MQRSAILFACFIISFNCLAQQYPYVHYTPRDGLVNSRVLKAYQDSKGRMYFLTYGGLSVYDGTRFRNYTKENGLDADLINDIYEIGEDSFLLAPNTGQINILSKGKISRLKPGNGSFPTINKFYRHSNNTLYLSSDDGLFRFQNNQVSRLTISPLDNIPANRPMLENITGFGNYLIICTNATGFEGIYLYDIKNNRICDQQRGSYLSPAGRDKQNRIWINDLENFYTLDTVLLKSGKLSMVRSSELLRDPMTNPLNTVRFYNNDVKLLSGLQNKERKYKVQVGEKKFMMPVELPGEIINTDIRHILIDRENSIWLCSNGGGVFKIVPSPIQFTRNPVINGATELIYSVNPSSNETWYSSETGRLYRKRGNEMTTFTTNLEFPYFIFSSSPQKLFINNGNNIYEAAIHEGKNNIVFKKLISLPDSTYFTSQLLIDPYANIISGIKNGLGVWKNNELVFFIPLPDFDLVESLAFDKNGLLWMVSRSSDTRVFRLHPEDHSHYLEPVHVFDKSLVPGSPRCMIIDRKGFIWIGTRENGLFRFRQEGSQLKKLEKFNTKGGMTDNFIVSLSCDSSDNIIVGTQTGLDRIITTDGIFRIQNLTKSNNYFAYISDVWTDPGNIAYAKTHSGVVIQIAPADQGSVLYKPELLMEEMRVNAEPVDEKKRLSHKQNNLSFQVAAPSFIDEKRVSYSYLLEGSGNDQWSDSTTSNASINLINLSPGKYILHVKAFFPSTPYAPTELTYPFVISPPWWQTWWFRIIMGLLTIGLLIITTRFYYRRKLEKQKLVLEKQQAVEKERTRIATDMHDDLGAGLSRIKFLSQALSRKAAGDESIAQGLNKITGYSDEMAEKMGEIIWALNEKNDTLADLVAYTRSYAMEYLAHHSITCDVSTPAHLPDTFLPGETRRNIFLSVKECLHNIIKHSEATAVHFSIRLSNHIDITVHDNGKGIDLDNKRFSANGLENIQKRMKDLNGKATIINDKGTKIHLRIPL